MPHYRASGHALDRFRERFPCMAPLFSAGTEERCLDSCQRLARWAQHAHPVGVQLGFDLLLEYRVRVAGAERHIFFAVTPRVGVPDGWVIRTVLTEEMAFGSIARAQTAVREGGRRFRQSRRRRAGGRRVMV